MENKFNEVKKSWEKYIEEHNIKLNKDILSYNLSILSLLKKPKQLSKNEIDQIIDKNKMFNGKKIDFNILNKYMATFNIENIYKINNYHFNQALLACAGIINNIEINKRYKTATGGKGEYAKILHVSGRWQGLENKKKIIKKTLLKKTKINNSQFKKPQESKYKISMQEQGDLLNEIYRKKPKKIKTTTILSKTPTELFLRSKKLSRLVNFGVSGGMGVIYLLT